jgi:autotransporter family porin
MRYARLLARLFLVFILAAIGSQLLRHVVAGGGFKSEGILAVGDGSKVRSAQATSAVPTTTTPPSTSAPKPRKPAAKAHTSEHPSSTGTAGAAAGSTSNRGKADGAGPGHFETLGPGAALPSGSQCASWVRGRPLPERKAANRAANHATAQHVGSLFDPGATDPKADSRIAARVDGAFTGTTQEILRWTACKWGIDENLVYAQAAVESWWRQSTEGDWAGDASACAPGHGLGADGRAGQCPQSFGILQNRYPYERSTWPGIQRSTAMNADTAYAIWRACFEGYEHWLNDVSNRHYGPGDAWGCVGRWFSGRWHTGPAELYVVKVKDYLAGRIWEMHDFQEA